MFIDDQHDVFAIPHVAFASVVFFTFWSQSGGLDGNAGREVPCEEGRVQVHTPDDPRRAQPDDAPIVARRASPAGLPAVHPLPIFRVDIRLEDRIFVGEEVLRLCEPIVCGEDDLTAVLEEKSDGVGVGLLTSVAYPLGGELVEFGEFREDAGHVCRGVTKWEMWFSWGFIAGCYLLFWCLGNRLSNDSL